MTSNDVYAMSSTNMQCLLGRYNGHSKASSVTGVDWSRWTLLKKYVQRSRLLEMFSSNLQCLVYFSNISDGESKMHILWEHKNTGMWGVISSFSSEKSKSLQAMGNCNEVHVFQCK